MRTNPLPVLMLSLLAALPARAEAPEEAPVPPEAPAAARADVPEDAAEDAPAAGEQEAEAAGADGDETRDGTPAEAETGSPGATEDAAAPTPEQVRDNEVDEPAEPVVVAPPEAGPTDDPVADAACEAALAELGVTFERIEPLTGDGACGAPRPLLVTAVSGIELRPELRTRCPVAEALALWIGRVAAPLADLYMDESLSAVLIGTGYQCRRRRGDATAKWSEHAFANAVDISGVMFESGDVMAVEPRENSEEPERSYQAGIRGGACAFFTTVLGPTTNASHADHLHLDMAERRGGYRLCE